MSTRPVVSVRPLRETEIAEARRIVSLAFGTFLGLADPESFSAGRDYISHRWRAAPESVLAAEVEGRLAGSNLLTRWGSFGFFGPLTVLPEYWDRGVAQALLGPTMELFARGGVRDVALFTFAQSPKHVGLYQKFGFWPGALTALLSAPVVPATSLAVAYSGLTAAARAEALAACRQLTDSIHAGLDVSSEIEMIAAQGMGETLLLWGTGALDGFACCHCGAGTEAGADALKCKFAAVRPGPAAPAVLDQLLQAMQALAAARCLRQVDAAVSVARRRAYAQMLQRGFRTGMLGVSMHRPDTPVYNRPDVFVLDDWR